MRLETQTELAFEVTVIENPAWIAIAISAASLAFAIYSFRSKAATQKVQHLETKIDRAIDRDRAIEARVSQIENELKHLPDKDVTHRLEITMMQISGKMDALTESFKPVNAISNRLQELLLEKATR